MIHPVQIKMDYTLFSWSVLLYYAQTYYINPHMPPVNLSLYDTVYISVISCLKIQQLVTCSSKDLSDHIYLTWCIQTSEWESRLLVQAGKCARRLYVWRETWTKQKTCCMWGEQGERTVCVCVCVADIIYRIDEVPCVVMWCLFGVCFSKCS